MNGMMAAVLCLAVLEFVVVVVVVAHLHRRVKLCAGCDGRLKAAHAALARVRAAMAVMYVGGNFQNGVVHAGADEGEVAVADLYGDVENLCNWVLNGYPHYHHLKRSSNYRLLSDGIRMNFAGRVRDGDEMVLYQDLDTGSLSVRAKAEFLDGRFRLLD